MHTLTAHILIGPGTSDGLGVPSHALYLTEHSAPIWTLAATGIRGRGPQVVEKLAWIPTVHDMLEDGLLMLGLHVAGFPELRQLADRYFKEDWRGEVEMWRDITPDHLRELHALNRQQDWQEHLAITVMFNSTIMNQLGALRQYRFGLDLCTWRFWRHKVRGHVKVMVCDENPADLLMEDDTP